MLTQKHQAISYSRFSSSKQSKGSSIARQQELFKEWLSTNYNQYIESSLVFSDFAISAYRGKNIKSGALGAIIKYIDQGLIQRDDVLVVEAIDRLSRADALEAFDLIRTILSSGVKLITLEDNQTYDKESFNNHKLYLLIARIQAAHEYSTKLSSRVKAAWSAKEARARSGQAVHKLHNIPVWVDRESLKLNDLAPMIKQLIDVYLSGSGIREVCFYAREELGYDLDARTLGRWLDNDSLLGLWRGVQCFAPLLTEQEFYELQEQRKARTLTSQQSTFRPLSGLLVCACCDTSFTFRTQRPTPTAQAPVGSDAYAVKPLIVYGNCRKYLHNKSCSNGATVPEEVALHVYKESVDSLLYDLAYVSALEIKGKSSLNELIHKRDRIQAEYKSKRELFELNLYDEDEKKEVIPRLQVLNADLASLNDEISNTSKDYQQFVRDRDQLLKHKEAMTSGKGIGADAALDFYPEGLNPEFEKMVRDQVSLLHSNPILLRSKLKQSGFRIRVSKTSDGRTRLTCNHSVNPSSEWIIAKRSQLRGCYVVEHRSFVPVDVDQHPDADYSLVEDWVSELVDIRR